jgi:chemotaxis protein MotB
VPDARSESDVRRFVEARGLSASVEVESTIRGVVLRVRDRALFDSGSADVRVGAESVLSAVLELSRDFPGALAVEGHTDDRPIRTALYPSNWELSAARAASVLRYLVEGGLQANAVHIAGYADLRPLTANTDALSRARNRRVEFVFEARHGS